MILHLRPYLLESPSLKCEPMCWVPSHGLSEDPVEVEPEFSSKQSNPCPPSPSSSLLCFRDVGCSVRPYQEQPSKNRKSIKLIALQSPFPCFLDLKYCCSIMFLSSHLSFSFSLSVPSCAEVLFIYLLLLFGFYLMGLYMYVSTVDDNTLRLDPLAISSYIRVQGG